MTREERAYRQFKILVNSYCMGNFKMTTSYQTKIDKAYDKWQSLLTEVN